MKILLVGCTREAAAMLHASLHDQRHEITHCAEGDRAIVELCQRGRCYDWAIVNGRVMAGGKRELAHILRTMGSCAVTDHQTDPALNDHIASPITSCGVEWTQGGVLQLHCALHSQLRKVHDAAAHDHGCLEGDIAFEYHAPCSTERKRNV